MAVDAFTSDLFFNLDMQGCHLKDDKGKFGGWDEQKMLEQAKWFVDCYRGLGIDKYTPEQILNDFYGRV